MELTPDSIIFGRIGPVVINATLAFTWLVMVLLVGGSWLISRNLSTGTQLSRPQNILETLVTYMRDQIREIVGQDPSPYLPFIGTLFLFISFSNLLIVFPGYLPPTGSLYTTGALALCVFIAVPVYGIAQRGLRGYLRNYVRPSIFLLPFQLIGEVSRTIALAVRLFGNIMSGNMIVAIMLSIMPLFLPVALQVFGLLIGQIQAYIFAVLAMVYIASATRAEETKDTAGTEPR